MASRRSYGTGRSTERTDRNGRVTWYGSWWCGTVRVKRTIGLKRTPGSSDGLTRVQAEKELRRVMAQHVAVLGAQRRTLSDAGDAYLEHLEQIMERKRSTIQDYRGYLSRHLTPFFGKGPIDKIDAAKVTQYLVRKRKDGLSSKTVQNHLNFLHGLFRFSVKRGWAPSNPVAQVDRPKKIHSSNQRLKFLQPHELDKLIAAVPPDTLGELERVLYLAAATTGLRQGELLGLKWMDVDQSARRVRVADNFTRGAFDTPKSHEGRSVPMAGRLSTELKELHKRSRFHAESNLVFCHPHTGNPYDPSKMRKRYCKAVEAAGVREITFHQLRHTFGTQIAAQGAPLRAIQEWMGHADAKTTEIYRHYQPDPTNGAKFVDGAFGTGEQNTQSDDDNPDAADSGANDS
jgi:integrase